MNRILRSELLKIRTTKMWWLFAIAMLVMTGLALTYNGFYAHEMLKMATELPPDMPPEEVEQYGTSMAAQTAVVTHAANIFTSGQYFGLLFVLLLGMLLVTNEYHHQTATATFLATPRRTTVVIGKLVAAMVMAAGFWLLTTAVSLAVGVVFFQSEGVSNHLGDWKVIQAILLNLLAYAVWGVFGVGFGALIRNQIGAVVTGLALYLIGSQVAQGIIFGIYTITEAKWVMKAAVLVPTIASQLMLQPMEVMPGSPPQWAGAAVLIGYGIVTGVIGTAILRRRDIS